MRNAEGGGLLAHFFCKDPIGNASLALLARIPDVVEVELSGDESKQITAQGLKHFAAMPSLRKLDLNGIGGIDEDALAELKGCQSLKELILINFGIITDKGVKHLAGIPKLQKLNIHGARLTADSIEHFKKMKSLTHLKITYSGLTPEVSAILRRLPGVEVEVGVQQ